MILFLVILSIFCLIGSINAVELSDNNINQNKYDNIINNIEQEEEDTNIENFNGELSHTYEDEDTILDETPQNQIRDVEPTTIYVSADGDDLLADGSEKNPFKTIKQGIDNSEDGSTIHISEGTFDEFNINIDKTLTIEGVKDKTVIDGKNIFRIFVMDSNAKLTLIGLTLINGNIISDETGIGGAIYNDGGELTLINCTIKDSYASYNGGAIYSNNGKLTIINSNIINNSAVQYGGALYSAGITHIEKSYFSENHITAEKGVGGAIACGGIASISDTIFLKNYAIYSAGAILSLANTTINNCSFINQTTEYTGGAISNHNYMIINNSQFIGGYARFYAAAILAPPSGQHVVTEVYNTVFDGNHVTNHAAVSNNFNDTELKMENCALINNYIYNMDHKFYGDVALDDNASLLYCWWGQNDIGNYYSPHNDDWESWKINASRWLIMTFTSDHGIIEQEKDNLLTVSLHQYFDNETKEIYDYSKDINLPLNVKFYTSTGKTIDNVIMKNGTAIINYTPEPNVRYLYAKLNNQTLNISVKMKNESKIAVADLTKYYKANKSLNIKLTDGNSSPLINKIINISISGKTYSKKTDSNGMVKLDINSYPGTYDAIISFIDDDYKNQKKTVKITVLKNSTSINARNMVKYFKNGTKLTVKLLDNNKKVIKAKVIKIHIGGKTISAKTNIKGIATFTINNKVGTYNVKVSFYGDKIYKASAKTIKVYVKSARIAVKNTKVKRNSNLVVMFKDKDGKYIKNTKVKFRLNGKTYFKTTNSLGQAKLKVAIKLGTYTLKTSFRSTKLYGATVFSNRIKVIKQ